MKKLAILSICIFTALFAANAIFCISPGRAEHNSQQTTIDAVVEIHPARSYNDPTTNLVVQDMILRLSGVIMPNQPFEGLVSGSHYASFDLGNPELKQAYTDQRQSWNATLPDGLKFNFEQSGKTASTVNTGNELTGSRGMALTEFNVTAQDQSGSGLRAVSGDLFTSTGVTGWFQEYSNLPEGGQTHTVNTGVNGNFTFNNSLNAPNRHVEFTGILDLGARALAQNNFGFADALVKLLYVDTITGSCPQPGTSGSGIVNASAMASNQTYTAKISGSVTTP